MKNYPFISRPLKDDELVKYCSREIDINAVRVGKNDLTNYIVLVNHDKNYTAACETQKITRFFTNGRDRQSCLCSD